MQKISFINQIELDICKDILSIPITGSLVIPNGVNSWRYNGDPNNLMLPSDYSNPCLNLMIEPVTNTFIFSLKPLSEFMDYITNQKIGKLGYPKVAVPVIANSNQLVAKDNQIRQKLIGDLI